MSVNNTTPLGLETVSGSSGVDSHSRTEIGINAWIIMFSIIFYSLRLFVRINITKSPGLDDVVAGVAFALLVTQSGMDIGTALIESKIQAGTASEGTKAEFFKLLVIETLTYFWTIAMVRFSLLAFLPRILRDRRFNIISWAVALLIFCQTIIAFVFRLTECEVISDLIKPPILPGLRCIGLIKNNKMMIGHGVVGVIVDVILLILPIWMICAKMMWSKKTLQIVLVLSVGLCAVVIGSVRVVVISKLDFASSSLISNMHLLGIWTNLEGHIGLWCGCFPALQPILRITSSMPNRFNVFSSTNSDGNKNVNANGPNGTARVYGAGGESYTMMNNESQRAIVLLEMKKPKTATRDVDSCIV
ncbi:hypothetical protein K445DRAFT_292654 [Daldinia sp. EC12]|nr:hypothetical protein F4774DRAFT_227035 [Daldinia eschscholtzii]OTB16512.1 hypothetical protein K445DRAFT_292654 [Daldinia sp. EC12]